MYKIPNQETRIWNQPNNSDVFGNVFSSRNLSFDEEGYLKLGLSSRAVMNDTIDVDFDNCAAIIRSDDHGYLALTWDEVFNVASEILASTPVQNTDTGIFGTDIQTDGVWFGGLLAVSQDTDLDYYNPATNQWTDTNISLSSTSQGQHPVEHFLSFNALAVANINTVSLYTSPLTATPILSNTLTIPSDFYITSIKYFNQNLYVGTMHRYGGRAALYVWNGLGSAAQGVYEVDSNIIFDVEMHNDGIVCLLGNGAIMRFTGASFTFLAGFPIYYSNRHLTDETNISIYHNSMKSNGDLLYISFADTANNKEIMLNQPNGIWCYDPKVGLYHRYSFSNSIVRRNGVPTANVNTSTNQITVSSAPVTGTEIYYRSAGGSLLAPLKNETKYFAIKVDSTHIQLATTKANALAGTPIDLTSTGNDNQGIVIFPNIDYGQILDISRSHALNVINLPVALPQYGLDVIWSAQIAARDAEGAGDPYLGSVSTGVEARGGFMTPKLFSKNVTDDFNKISMKYAPLGELDKIIIRYRTVDDGFNTVDLSNTAFWHADWTDTDTFTSTDTHWATAKDAFDAGKKYTIIVLRGAAGGLYANIENIQESGGTYTVTIDEEFADFTAGDVSTIIFRNFEKFKTLTVADTDGYFDEQLGINDKFAQFDVEIRGIGTKIEDFQVDNVYALPAGS